MSKYVVTVLDTTGIQSYVFNSNRLRENIGASYLVAQATGDWVRDKLEQLGVPKNRQHEPMISSGLVAQVVYQGGGNAVLLFQSMDHAKEFTQNLTYHILKYAPGLKLVVAHAEFDWHSDCLYQKIEKLQTEDIDRQKRCGFSSSPLLGLGVTATCQSTQLPAVNTSQAYINADEEDIYFISRETEQKLEVVSSKAQATQNVANQTLREKFKDVLGNTNYQFPYRMDHLGRSRGESSYYAVVHADGNNMGERFKEYGKASRDNPDYVNRINQLSSAVNQAGLVAVKKVVKILINSIDQESKVMGKFPIFIQNDQLYLPFRPLIYGGDDITFVCDGRLGLELANIYLEELQKEFDKQSVTDGKPLTACAGVCIVKSHYPFARAYELSEALCANAKKFAREQKQLWGKDYSAIDWHIATSGLFGSISDIRRREYSAFEGNLTMRPLLIQDEYNQWRNWLNFTNILECFNGSGEQQECEEWKERRNKVLALPEKLRQGRKSTQQFLKAYRLGDLPNVTASVDQQTLKTEGWTEKHCGYFDAIEAMEFYFPLNKGGIDVCL